MMVKNIFSVSAKEKFRPCWLNGYLQNDTNCNTRRCTITPNKRDIQITLFLISPHNIPCGAFKKYPQHMFSWKNKKTVTVL